MPCPTCSHTLQCVITGEFTHPAVYWCPRCGTLRVSFDVGRTDEVPKLVERCRQFRANWDGVEFERVWHRYGIAESIHPPEDRP